MVCEGVPERWLSGCVADTEGLNGICRFCKHEQLRDCRPSVPAGWQSPLRLWLRWTWRRALRWARPSCPPASRLAPWAPPSAQSPDPPHSGVVSTPAQSETGPTNTH